ncbi:hypothetical protein C8F01DRAFT_1250057 [Mycena amicta]|nr:hypothetical protein C8F01DRAFT_1250057 [Mycena amicta]
MAESQTSSAPRNTSTADGPAGFSLSASPPLILAFLAVGIFGIAMAGFFLRKRWADRHMVPVTGQLPMEYTPPLQPPKLWDVSCPGQAADSEWMSIQPLSATIWDATRPTSPRNAVLRHEPVSLSTQVVTHLHRREAPADKSGPCSIVRLQVAVTIAMPEPDYVEAQTDPQPFESDTEDIAALFPAVSPSAAYFRPSYGHEDDELAAIQAYLVTPEKYETRFIAERDTFTYTFTSISRLTSRPAHPSVTCPTK